MRIDTERLVIRPFEPCDLAQFRLLLDIPELEGWRMQKNRAEAFLNWQIGNYTAMDIVHGAVCFGIFDREGNILGAAGAGEHDDLHEPEVFYHLLPGARGRGIATEACAAVTEWALREYDIPCIIGTAAVDNFASRRVLEKCGYELADTRRLKVHILDEDYEFAYYRRNRRNEEEL